MKVAPNDPTENKRAGRDFRESVATRNLLLREELKKQIPRFARNERPGVDLDVHG